MLCTQHQPRPLPTFPRSHSGKVEISRLLKPKEEEESPSLESGPSSTGSVSAPITHNVSGTTTSASEPTAGPIPTKRPLGAGAHPDQSPAKKQSKWSPEEDAKIIQLRGENMKWEDISKHLPGRSPISCRLHYQNYLERRSEWDEDRKNKLARLYERFKADMWAKIADEMSIPWRAAEAMHWHMGEVEMARRAGVTPFALTSNTAMPVTSMPPLPRSSHMRNHSSAARTTRDPSIMAMQPQQLPSVAELTSGLPAYSALSAPLYYPRTTSSDLQHHTMAPRR